MDPSHQPLSIIHHSNAIAFDSSVRSTPLPYPTCNRHLHCHSCTPPLPHEAAQEGKVVIVRAVDDVHSAIQRLKNYHKHHKPTMDWLKSIRVPIVKLDCLGSKEDVWQQLMTIGRLMRHEAHSQDSQCGRGTAAADSQSAATTVV
jgi:hypothetical protein